MREHSAGGEFIWGTLKDRKYTVTFAGGHRTLAIDHQTRGNLADIANEVFAAFPKLSAKLPPLNLSKVLPAAL